MVGTANQTKRERYILHDVGYHYEDNKLKYVGDNIENERKRVKDKYIEIVETMYKKEIWPFEG